MEKMKIISRHGLSAAVCAVFLSIIICVPAFAQNSETAVVEGCGGGVFDAYASVVIDSFEGVSSAGADPASNWSAAANTSEPYASVPDFAPYSAFYGSQCLIVPTASTGEVQSRNRSVTLGLDALLPAVGDVAEGSENGEKPAYADLSSYSSLGMALLCPDSALTYTAIVNIASGLGSRAFSSELSGGVWNAVFCGLEDWEGASEVTGITVSVRCSELDIAASYSFCADSVALFEQSPDYLASSMKFLTDPSNYYIGGASIDTGLGTLYLTPRSDSVYIETYSLPDGLSLRYDELRMNLDNSCGADTATLYYTTETDMTFSGDRSYSVKLSSGVQNVYFPLDQSARQLRVVFDGADYITQSQSSPQYIEIYVFCGVSTGKSYESAIGSVDSCVWSSGSVTVSGTVAARASELYRGYQLGLFLLSPVENNYMITSGRAVQLSSAKVSDTFKFKLEPEDPEAAMTGRYVVAVNYGGSYLILGSAYISNPEDYSGRASFSGQTQTVKSIKGVTHDSSSDPSSSAAEAYLDGVGGVICEIRLEKLVSTAQTGLSETFGGNTVWFGEDYVSALDEMIGAYSLTGESVTLRVTASHTSSVELNSLVCHPDAARSSEYAALNTTTQTGINTLAAAFKFIARRYADLGVSGVILGCASNDAYDRCNMGTKDLADFVSGSAASLRLMSSVLRMYGGPMRIYISVDNLLDSGYPSTGRNRYDASVYLDALTARLKECGDLDFRVEFVMNSDALNCGYADRTYVGAADFDRLTGYLALPSLCYKNSARSVMITSSGVPSESAVAYSYYRLCGVSSLDSLNLPAAVLSRYETLCRYIDAQSTLEASSGALATLGITEGGWSEVISGFDTSKAVRRSVCEAEAGSALSSDGALGSYSLGEELFSSGGGYFWSGSVGCSAVSAESSIMGRSDVTQCSLSLDEGGSVGGCAWSFEYPLDLTGADALTLELALAKMPSGISTMNAVFVLSSGGSRAIFRGTLSDGTALRDGSWNTVGLDLTAVPGAVLASVDTITVFVSFESGSATGRPALFIDTATLYSSSRDSDQLKADFEAQKAEYLQSTKLPLPKTLLWSMTGVIILSLGLLIVRVELRKTRRIRRREENEWKF